MDLGLTDRAVIVTGATRGIGRAAALGFAREGARILITYRSDAARAERTVAELRAAGARDAAAAFLDLADPPSIEAAVTGCAERWGRVDTLVNNAVQWGTRPLNQAPPFEEVARDYWRPLFEANFEGHYLASQAAVRSMRAHGSGRIVHISSGIAADGLPGAGPYGAAKAALHGLTRTLAKELGPIGVLVNVVMPGFTMTERNLERVPQHVRDEVAATAPIRRLLAPDEVVPVVVFLGSPLNTAVTGEIIRSSGGAT